MDEVQKKKGSFTGLRRERKTSRSIVITDYLARFLITFGGIGTIVAVLTVCAFLVWEVIPLFLPAKVVSTADAKVEATDAPIDVALDEYQRLGYAVHRDGSLRIFRADTGTTIQKSNLLEGKKVLSSAFANRTGAFVLGLDDGNFQYGQLTFATRFFDPKKEPQLAAKLEKELVVDHQWQADEANDQGELVKVTRVGIVDKIPTGDLRGHTVTWRLEKPRKAGAPVLLVDMLTMSDGTPTVVTYTNDAAPSLQVHTARKITNATTGIDEVRFSRPTEIPMHEPFKTQPAFVRASSQASNVYLSWADGRTWRYRSIGDNYEFMEEIDLVESPDAKLAVIDFVIGRETFVAGHTDGALQGWFTVPFDGKTAGWEPHYFKHPEDLSAKPVLWVFKKDSPEFKEFRKTGGLEKKVLRKLKNGETIVGPDDNTLDQYLSVVTPDRRRLVKAKDLTAGKTAVTSISPSQRSRLIAVGFADGKTALYNVTSEARLLVTEESGEPIMHALIAPKDDALAAATATTLHRWQVNIRHPEASFKSMFTKVWYEGYEEPKHMWQSSAGTDETEPKLGLMPLVWGTLKATFYSMLFGVPLALLAAVYTSEFLKPHIKARVKPAIEMMASLPSVVLGFIAAIWLAPRVELHLAGVLSMVVCVPFFFLVGAYIWQLVPYHIAVKWREYRFLVMLLIALPLGVSAGLLVVGPLIERSFLLGDTERFLHGSRELPRIGSPIAAWMILLLPLSALVVAFINGRVFASPFKAAASNWTRQQAATYDFIRFAVLLIIALVLAFLASLLMGSLLDTDPRGAGKPLDTFDPRNALVVGFIMGFAVIPIIYTIAEDAMSTVPDHLRAASLGAGAAHWQTAVRIVIPTAMSGLFSACMIGLGRAVGETMIVLMAAGGTAIMEVNIFNGFRTLSANIATELPEAPPYSTHYRTLFLAGLVLFVLTFAVNTVAEAVRQRFRRRAFQL